MALLCRQLQIVKNHNRHLFGNLPDLTSIKTHQEKYIIRHSRQQMYEIVSSVHHYKLFLPWCHDSFFVGSGSKDSRSAEAVLDIGYPPFIERYTSTLTMEKTNFVRAVCQNGRLFKHLETMWRFGDVRATKESKETLANACSLEYQLRFESSMSVVTAAVNSVFFDAVAEEMVNAFLKRAAHVYGPPSRAPIRLR